MLHHETLDIGSWSGGKLPDSDPELGDSNPTEIGMTAPESGSLLHLNYVYMVGGCRREWELDLR